MSEISDFSTPQQTEYDEPFDMEQTMYDQAHEIGRLRNIDMDKDKQIDSLTKQNEIFMNVNETALSTINKLSEEIEKLKYSVEQLNKLTEQLTTKTEMVKCYMYDKTRYPPEYFREIHRNSSVEDFIAEVQDMFDIRSTDIWVWPSLAFYIGDDERPDFIPIYRRHSGRYDITASEIERFQRSKAQALYSFNYIWEKFLRSQVYSLEQKDDWIFAEKGGVQPKIILSDHGVMMIWNYAHIFDYRSLYKNIREF